MQTLFEPLFAIAAPPVTILPEWFAQNAEVRRRAAARNLPGTVDLAAFPAEVPPPPALPSRRPERRPPGLFPSSFEPPLARLRRRIFDFIRWRGFRRTRRRR